MSSEEGKRKITLCGDELAEVALSTIRAVIGTDRYQYLSGPITGGRRLIEWQEKEGRTLAEADDRAASKAAVVVPNIEALQKAAAIERAEGRPTIEPGSFEADFPHWEQEDFLRFWERVIESHSETVRFLDGWQFSSGCAFEYLCARKHSKPTYDMNGNTLGKQAALALLDQALEEIGRRYNPADPRDAPIGKLRSRIHEHRSAIAALP